MSLVNVCFDGTVYVKTVLNATVAVIQEGLREGEKEGGDLGHPAGCNVGGDVTSTV